MNKSIETQAKTIEAAINEALTILGASYDEVDVDIIQEAGFLKKAKIRATIKVANSQAATPAQASQGSTSQTTTSASAQTSPTKAHLYTSSSSNQPITKPTQTKQASIKAQEKQDAETKDKSEKKEKSTIAPAQKTAQANESLPEKFQTTLNFAIKLIELLGNTSEVTYEMTDKSFNINANGTGAGQIIGKGGEVLNAIQTIISSIALVAERKSAQQGHDITQTGENKRVYFNVEDYKERRIETLKSLAARKAEKVKETGRYIKLEPMNARDRAIIHGALQEIQGIRTYSTGKEPHRCLCIAPARKEDKESLPNPTF